MTTPHTPRTDFAADQFEAQVRQADAKLSALKAQAEAKQAKAEMDEISGLTAAREQVRKDIAALKKFAAADYAQTKSDFEQARKKVETGLSDLETRIEQTSERYTAWDDARERRLNARLDEADAKMKFWKSKSDARQAQNAMKSHDAIATLEEKVAIARARSAEARTQRYAAKSVQALDDAARYFDQAYDAAAKRYDRGA